ncbi:hypothetical protein AWB67_07184 [Caballeronia terrestris]|uniref:Uncharacterized protein n=1 Tax=Caballeronia terrestris TaxID=1226301 RepID=A0A158KZ50_9BURK|nr:transporter suffix domain-containing protein [Caballeronia terrestris]SAL86387.1 hypothetical protein AWB67_07184 [Caballeronia terrestris]
MTAPDVQIEAVTASTWRFNLGIYIFVLAFALWLLTPLAASLGTPAARIAALTGTIFVANKVLLLTCIAVMGKSGFQRLIGIVFGYAKGLAPSATVGPIRHAIGLVMFCLPLISRCLNPTLINSSRGSGRTSGSFRR